MSTTNLLFKMLMLGDSGVGKTSLVTWFTERKKDTSVPMTIGVDFQTKFVHVHHRDAKLQIYDTPGSVRFQTITSSYYRMVHGIMIVYDVSNRESFSNVKSWRDQIERYACEDVKIVLVGNKCDKDREVSHQEGVDLAESMEVKFFETSLKNPTDDAFLEMTRLISQWNISNKELLDSYNDPSRKRIMHAGLSMPQQNGCC